MASRLSAPARWGIGIAAVLVVLVGVAALFQRGASPGIGAAPTPTASASASPSSSASASAGSIPLNEAQAESSCGDGIGHWCLAAGSYKLSSSTWPQPISFDVPEGWFPYLAAGEIEGVLVESGQAAPEGSGWGPMFAQVSEVARDPCDAAAGTVQAEETATVDGFIAAMRAWPDFAVSDARPVEVDGHAGKLVTITSTRKEADCAAPTLWTTPVGSKMDAYPMVSAASESRTGTYRVIDVDDTLLVIRTTEFADPSPHELSQGVQPDPTRHAADLVEMQQILDSIRVGS